MGKKWLGILFVLPALMVFAVLVWGPIIANVVLSFFSWDIVTPSKFVGLDNYINLFRDKLLWKYIGNTIFFFIEAGAIFLLVMLMVSLVGKTSKDVQSRIRILFLIPTAATFPVAHAIIWRWLFNPDFGLINCYIKIFHIAPKGPDWFSNSLWAKPAMSIYSICAYSGFWICLGLIIFTAVWYNTKTFKFAVLMPLAFIFLLTMMDIVPAHIMTGGGPAGATTKLAYYTYNNAYQWFKFGYATTLVILQLILPVLLGILAWYFVNKYKICCVLESRGKTGNLTSGNISQTGSGRVISLIILSIVILLPWVISLFWAFSTSLKPPGEIFVYPPAWIPKNPTWSNYVKICSTTSYFRFILNTFYVSIAIALLQIIIIFFGAYSLSILRPFGNKLSTLIFFLISITIFIPLSTINIPVFAAVYWIRWIDTYRALIIPNIAWAMGFLMMKIYFDGLVPEILQRRKDGYTESMVFREIILPKGLPWALMLAVVSMFQNWHAFYWPLITTNSMEKKVLYIVTASFQGLYPTEWNMLMAGAVTNILVTMVIFLSLFIWCEKKVWRRMRLVTG